MDGAGCNVREARQRGDEPWRGKLSVVVSVGGIRMRWEGGVEGGGKAEGF